MKLEIKDAIESLIPPNQLEAILEAVDLLLQMDYVLALDELNTVLMIADDYADSSMLVGRINDILVYALNFILNERDVVVSDDANLPTRLAVVNTLLYIPNYIIPTDLAHIFQENLDPVETMAELVAFFSDLHQDDLVEQIEAVGENTLGYLKTVVNERVQNESVAIERAVNPERIQLINKLIRTNPPGKFSMMLELANAGLRVGRPYDELINMSFEGLESKTPEDAAAQLVGLAFFSNLELGQIWPHLNISLDEYTDNPMERRMMVEELATIKRNLGESNV